MIGLLCFALAVLASSFKSKLRLEAENAVLRHQLIVLRRRLHGRVRLTNHDRWFFIQLYRWVPSILQVLTIIRSDTLERWHRAGFYNDIRTHRSWDKDAPAVRPVQRAGSIKTCPILGGLQPLLWHFPDMAVVSVNVRLREKPGHRI